MPVLTCPFTTIPATVLTILKTTYPEKTLISTELSIVPVAGETWSVEGLSLLFIAKYYGIYYTNTKKENETLESSLTSLKKSLAFIELQQGWLKDVEENRHAIYTKTPNEENLAAWREAIAALEKGKSEVEVAKKEINETEKQKELLGRTSALEGLRTAPLKINARLYARGNELVWNSSLAPTQVLTPMSVVRSGTGAYTIAEGYWTESLNMHTQYDDPIEITERENLKLTFEFQGPHPFSESAGVVEGAGFVNFEGKEIELGAVSAVVNYSH